ncbi:TetR family transcriptional regulator [Actinoplanes sp. OR16]|uniref:TetR/AcrR family transcriptional regulator n=1 Tax=Actinoplanes sp. OR16 TaxID=946334 RepID=UPI000F6DD400|nr:TetR/AcrR family transcriptional regulator C-terminal domain-containing protein [Actinoplanes sp. OR16]BBH71746.1 TetR family transcriptional regulator [Actinoplanes sp. OR16]
MAHGTRTTALSRERIVEAAVEILDASGESGLTFRTLSAALKTGAGAIYWHVANKGELLAAATDAVIHSALTDVGGTPAERIRGLAISVFDAVDAHPWVGEQMSRLAAQPTTLHVFERIGRQIQELGVPAAAQFNSASALLNYILGVAAQNAALAQSVAEGTDRDDVLTSFSVDTPFLRSVAGELRSHDDREQFLAGIDLILAGIAVSSSGTPQAP